MSLTRERALLLLEKYNCSKEVIEHCKAVSEHALDLARDIKSHGHDVDLEFVEVAALLHDIGRCKNHGVGHGIEGAKILRDFPRYLRVCESHIGSGITRDEAIKLGLPAKDYIPKTLEEKIVSYADSLIDKTTVRDLSKTLEEVKWELGVDSPAVGRLVDLDSYIRSLLS